MLAKRNMYYPRYSKLFNDFYHKGFGHSHASGYSSVPKVNIQEFDDKFEVFMAAPGMNKEDFNIRIEDNLLTISSEKKEENKENTEKYTRKEYSYQSFSRSFIIPKDVVNSQDITAKYENGELYISLPKKEEAKAQPPREISIN
jgi:HSP20 family protein